jgi:hypothetical protein
MQFFSLPCNSPSPPLQAQRSNPFWFANIALMDRRVAALFAMTDLGIPSLSDHHPLQNFL